MRAVDSSTQARAVDRLCGGRGAVAAAVMVGTQSWSTRTAMAAAARWLVWAGALGAWCGARELDPAACARRFDVQRDKIIRTEESRDMGARYLSELDVGARAECLRLCCETDACDVFVYEEKGPGSCYLFACGPPEDFRCKFTAHGNFSSGVLALSRRLAELQDAERAPPPPAPTSAPPPSATTPAPTTTTTTSTAAPAPAPSPPDRLLTHVGRCSRYQFECVVGGECIAVYNACDGVPQCADGSDEAPELGCPPLPAAAAQPPAQPRPAPPDRWPHRLTQEQTQHRYTEPDTSPHIFSHKGGLLQEAEAPPPPYQPFEPPWPRRAAWPQHQRVESMGGWGGGAGQGAPPPARLDWGERAWPVPPPAPPTPPRHHLESLYGAGAESGGGAPPQAEAAAPPPPPPRPAAPAPSPAPHTPAPRHDPHPHQDKAKGEGEAAAAAAAARVAAADGAAAAAEGDGLSARPPAALLLLVLGLLMTVALAGVAGCGAGAARRRLRRGKPLQHDADYLVNGMYL